MKNKTNKLFAIENIFFTLLFAQLILQYFIMKYEGGEPFVFVFFSMIGGLAVSLIPGLIISAIIFYSKNKKESFIDIFLRITSVIVAVVLVFSLIGFLS